MRILFKGKVPQKIERKKVCKNCHTIFAYTEDDEMLYGYGGDNYTTGIVCPVCKNVMGVSIFDRKVK